MALWRLLLLLPLFVLLLAPRPASALVIGPMPKRIVAVGDLHGDFAAWRAIARDAGLVDPDGRWAGGSTVLVQMGDVPDRGPDSRAIVRDLMQLGQAARRQGGRVIALVGNHEAMMLTGDLEYVSAGEFAAFADRQSARRRDAVFNTNRAMIEERYRARDPAMDAEAIRAAWMQATPLGSVELQAAWHPEGSIGRWVLGNPAVARIGDILFVHGGISAAYADWPVGQINAAVSEALAQRLRTTESIIVAPDGPLWYRGFARPESESAETLALVLERQGAGRMVVGHTPHLSGILMLHEGRLARIDSGISAVYGGTLSWLEISGDRMVAHSVARP